MFVRLLLSAPAIASAFAAAAAAAAGDAVDWDFAITICMGFLLIIPLLLSLMVPSSQLYATTYIAMQA